MPQDALDEHGVLRETTSTLKVVVDAGGEEGPVSRTQLRLGRVCVGGMTVENALCDVLPPGENARVGLAFLRYFTLTIAEAEDSAVLVLTPRKPGKVQELRLAGYGLSIERCRNGHWILGVALESPADRAGVKGGSSLLRIQGRLARHVPYAVLVDALEARKGETLEVMLEAPGGESAKFELTAEPML